MSNDQRPKKMAVYGGDAGKAAAASGRAPSPAAAQAGVAGAAGEAGAGVDEAALADGADGQSAAAAGAFLPIWAVLLFLVAGTAAGAAAVALIPRFAAQLIHTA